ncbi:response regulator transcription factor [Paenibacillus sp. 1P07SE]|uniref:response regulator transcription factor n=1 Tax=Paenibacillus sp. 1P07SE TaxID=3132209 RepID=UPI0039A533C7
MYKLMIVEDDAKIAQLLKHHIEKYGHEAEVVQDFEDVLGEFRSIRPHMVLMDVNLPRYDGFYWCRQLRTVSTCPILFISARSDEPDQVRAIENGGDDYLTKPFSYEIVMAKIRSQLRRVYGDYAAASGERKVESAGLVLYPERMVLQLAERTVTLTPRESALMETLMERAPRLVTRETMLEALWDDYTYVDDNALSVNVTRVRRKLAELGIADALETVRGTGYRLNDSWDGSNR